MKKNRVIIVLLLVISLITVVLYQTLATDITMNKTNVAGVDLSYTFDITDTTGRVVNVNAGATKILDFFLTNNNNGTINYGIAYTPSSVKTDDITIAELSGSRDSVSGTINKNEKKQITIVIVNNSTSNISLTLVPIAGYEHGGDLIVPSNHTLISDSYEIFEPVNASEYITSLVSSNPNTMNNDDPDNNVRYMGADPNNYVLFNNELWRIIGVFDVKSSENGELEKRIKIIRNKSLGNMAWNSGSGNDWTQASLQEYLNGDYYNSIDSISQNLIGDTYWNLGGTASYASATNGLASHFYGYERGATVHSGRPTYWVGKIGLMYPSDYGYATSGGTTTDRSSCLAKEMYSWDSSSYSDCKNNDYLYNSSSSQWTLTPDSSLSNPAFRVSYSGYIDDIPASNPLSASPVLYLKSTVEITGGEGSQSKPYTLQMPPMSAADYITSLLSSNPTTMNNDDPDNNVRYMGADPNNYVRFNNELWRIIGVFDVASTYGGPTEKRLKIIRDEPIGNYSWDNKPSGTGSSTSSSGSNDWTDSALMKVLNNGAYWNRTSGTCPNGQNGATKSCDFSSNGLTAEAKALIGDAVWNLGGTASYQSASNGRPSHFYGYERGTTVYSGRPTYWVGKIGLMYPSDYGYATSGGTTINRASCLAKEMYSWDSSSYSDCKNNDYLYNSSSAQWTITPNSGYSYAVFDLVDFGFLYFGSARNTDFASPVLYLKSTVEITGGEGTSGNPYTLG